MPVMFAGKRSHRRIDSITIRRRTGRTNHRAFLPGFEEKHQKLYQEYSESDFKQYLAEHFIRKLLKEFPEETRKALRV